MANKKHINEPAFYSGFEDHSPVKTNHEPNVRVKILGEMTDQKHTKQLNAINNNRSIGTIQAYILMYNLCDAVIKDLDTVTKQRDELFGALVALKEICKAEPAMNKKDYDTIGILVNNVLARAKGEV